MPPEVARLMGQVQDAGAQLAALRTENDQLRAEMEVRAQRRDVLLGERAQLEKQLAERDRRLAELEREIGALRAGAAPPRASGWPAPGGAPPRLAGVMAATRRLLASLGGGGGRPVAEAAAPWHARPVAPARNEAPLVPFVAEGRTPRTLAVAVFGLDRGELERVIEVVSSGLPAAADVVPVFLTDSDAFDLFRARRAVFEYLPPPDRRERLAPDLDWDLYVLRRLTLLRRKWQPARIIAFGGAARAVLAAWRECRFEDEDIKTLIEAPNGDAGPG